MTPLQTRGCTDLAAGWLGGCECVARVMECEPRLRNRVVLLSDGHANRGVVDPATLERHAAELRARGVLSSTVGIGVGYSPTQLQAIAEQGGGRMHDAERPEEIIEVVLAEFEDVAMTALENVEICLDLPQGVAAEPVGGLPSSLEGSKLRTVLGAMLSESTRTVVFKVTTPAGGLGESLSISVSAAWRWPGESEVQRMDGEPVAMVMASPQECTDQFRDTAVALDVARMWQMALVRRVMSLNADGAYAAAEQYARGEIKWFMRYCRDLPNAAELLEPLERLVATAGEQYDAVPAKEMLLASYKGLRGEHDRRSNKRGSWDKHLKS